MKCGMDNEKRKNGQYNIYSDEYDTKRSVKIHEDAGTDEKKRQSEDKFKESRQSAEQNAVGTVFGFLGVSRNASCDFAGNKKRGGTAFSVVEEE